jgi:hypothetical protein
MMMACKLTTTTFDYSIKVWVVGIAMFTVYLTLTVYLRHFVADRQMAAKTQSLAASMFFMETLLLNRVI